ncbi:two-component system response regulator [Mycolicibacterium parafortuitum]|uniref:PAS domain S-box/diguanylate cyclase (GGDEF) domain-containing protein [Dechlorosoma suillum PS] n=1 Tax=Mycolicibacterium parafortuitum TaxID=39692 RepID=A0A375YD87_MYCPF|nr:EAL domain-containing protein [Mycolicibacterium parafortuitum]SRX79050.1 PAS domain S-box/diguanylate cyclase (GGDEF) domain-containing protein [Dechlorosoma suillum PS] [Mycolicibacterium parafortuitum]
MTTPAPTGEESTTGDRQTVLVVDDDTRLRELLCIVLTPLDCDIAQAGSGEEALTMLLERQVAVIVLDINMPGMGGFETAQLIRDVEEMASTPIIFLTGQAEAGDLHRGYDLGAVDFLVKPVSRQVFYAKVKALLELDRSFARLRSEAARLHEQQLQTARAAEVRQRDELAITRRRERLTNIFAEASIDLASLERTIVTELSQMFDAECVLRLPTPDHGWHESLSHNESPGAAELLRALMAGSDAARIREATAYQAVMIEELTARSQRFGVVCVGRADGPAFTETESVLFRGASAAAALAISNATLYRVQAEYAAVMQATGDAILAVDVAGVIRSCNKAAVALFTAGGDSTAGADNDELLGMSICDLAVPAERQRMQEHLDDALTTRQAVTLEMTLAAHDGRHVEVMITMSPIGDSVDLLVAVVVHDLTEIKHAQTEIRHLASHDPLTDLANRRQLNDRLAALARQRSATADLVALLYLDVNHFKAVNDTYGHDTGDELLLEVAARLRSAVSEDTLVCRIGGDEFVVVFEEVRSAAAAAAAGDRILELVQSQPVHCGNAVLRPSISMGIACLGATAHTPEELLTQADMAMFEAKKSRSRVCVLYTDAIGSRQQGKVNLRAEVIDAIARSDLRMVYQPIVNAATGALFGVEALVRWRLAGDEIPATEIVSLAEDSGQAAPLGRWVLARSFADYAALGRDDLKLHVNVSPDQVLDSTFLDHLITVHRSHAIAPQRVCLELTERAFNRDPAPAHLALRGARDYGFSLAMDDFGVEHASMTNLMHVPVDWLKIDRSFIAEVHHDELAQRLVRSQIAVAQCMQVDVIAEGVEQQQQADWLRDAGCVLQQGFLYSPPIEVAELGDYLTRLG